MKLFDVVHLRDAMPDYGLERGRHGAIVQVLRPGVFKVEFLNSDGLTDALLTVFEGQLEKGYGKYA